MATGFSSGIGASGGPNSFGTTPSVTQRAPRQHAPDPWVRRRRVLLGEASKEEYLVIRDVLDSRFDGFWMSRAHVRDVLNNPKKEMGGFWVGQPKTWVWPTSFIETCTLGTAQVCRPRQLLPGLTPVTWLLSPVSLLCYTCTYTTNVCEDCEAEEL